MVAYRETVRMSSKAMAKSSNHHNRLYMSAEPLPENLSIEIEKGAMTLVNLKAVSETLVSKFGLEKDKIGKVWGFGPNDEGPNMLVDLTVGCQYVSEIKDHV